jgi:hypothetical protein
MVTAEARSFYLKPATQSWPVGDEQHALIALQYMTRGFGNRAEYPQLLERLRQRWPLDKHPRVAAAYKRLLPKIKEKHAMARSNPQASRVGLHLLIDNGTVLEGQEPVSTITVRVPRSPVLADWTRAAREMHGYLGMLASVRDNRLLVFAVTHSGKHIELSREDVSRMAQGFSDKALDNRGVAAGSDAAQIEANRREVEQMLKSPPSDWRSQFGSGASQLRQTGQFGGKELTREGALRILGITAGGNRSSDTARGGQRVPADVREEAMHGLRLSHANNYGAWNFIGVARAIQLATEPGVPTSTTDRMSNYFTRHAKDKQSANFGNDRSPSRGYMAWLNWGGDAGLRWTSSTPRKGR